MAIWCNLFNNYYQILVGNNILCHKSSSNGNLSDVPATNGHFVWRHLFECIWCPWTVHRILGKNLHKRSIAFVRLDAFIFELISFPSIQFQSLSPSFPSQSIVYRYFLTSFSSLQPLFLDWKCFWPLSLQKLFP